MAGFADLLKSAAAARTVISDAAADAIVSFVRSQQTAAGGFRGRRGDADLYYTLFAAACLRALAVPVNEDARLTGFAHGPWSPADLDLVHVAALLILLRFIGGRPAEGQRWRPVLAEFATPDGGYAVDRGAATGTAYGAYMASLAWDALGCRIPEPASLRACLANLRFPSGGYANAVPVRRPAIPATCAVLAAQDGLAPRGAPADAPSLHWLVTMHADEGGFRSTALAPCADLLSTATALFALRGSPTRLLPLAPACRRYVETLWRDGGFAGHEADEVRDCEYTFYGLLALGVLAALERDRES